MTETERQSYLDAQSETVAPAKHNGLGKKDWKKRFLQNKADYIFMAVMLLFPTLQFIVFYITTNVNSFALAFQKVVNNENGYYGWAGDFRNFMTVFENIANPDKGIGKAIGNSFLVYLIHLAAMPLGVLFAYYIFRKFFGHRLFKVTLFLPQIVSVFTMCFIYKYFSDYATKEIFDLKYGLFNTGKSNATNLLITLIFAYVFFGFGSSMLLYLGAMSGINESIMEAAEIDGANHTSMLFTIVLPQIYPTIKTFLIVGIALIFTDQFNLLSFFTATAPKRTWTIGYYFYYELLVPNAMSQYPYLAAFGLIISVILIPITLVANKWLDKLDPTD